MTSPESDARADLLAKQKEAQASIPELEGQVKSATSAIRSIAKEGSPAQIVEASGVLSAAQRKLDGAQGDIEKLARGLVALDKAHKRDKVTSALTPIVDAFMPAAKALPKGCKAAGIVPEGMLQAHKSALEEADVKSVTYTLDRTGDVPLASVKPSGAEPRAPSTRKGNGGFSKVLYATPAGDLSQTDVFKSYAIEAGVSQERYDLVLADPSNQGISHRGKAVASKMGFEQVTPA